MKNILLFIFLFSGIVVAQNHDNDKVTYLDFNQKPTSKANAVYYEFTTAYKNGIWKYQKFFLSSATKAFLVEKYYFDKNNLKQGKYKEYFNTGTLRKEGIYIDDKKNGQWKYYAALLNAKDSVSTAELLGIVTYKNDVKEGFFKDFHFDNKLMGEGNYKNDKFIGECKWYHYNGQMSSLENYSKPGKLQSIRQWDENGVEKTKNFNTTKDLEANKKRLSAKISNELGTKISKYRYNQKGTVYIYLIFDRNGKINVGRIKASSGVSSAYKNEVKKVIDHMPLQEPIYAHNQAIDYRFTLVFSTFSRTHKTYTKTVIHKSSRRYNIP